MEHTISRYEEQGDSLFICLNSSNNPVYLEHFFTEDEKKDKKGTIEGLVAELELMDEDYVAPLPRVSKVEEAQAIVLSNDNIAIKKAAKILAKAKAIEDAKPKETTEEQ